MCRHQPPPRRAIRREQAAANASGAPGDALCHSLYGGHGRGTIGLDSSASQDLAALVPSRRLEFLGNSAPCPRPTANPPRFANHWEYSSENTRFQIDQPEQIDA